MEELRRGETEVPRTEVACSLWNTPGNGAYIGLIIMRSVTKATPSESLLLQVEMTVYGTVIYSTCTAKLAVSKALLTQHCFADVLSSAEDVETYNLFGT